MTDYAAFARLGVATVHEAAGRIGIVDLPLTQVVPGSRVAGPARIAALRAARQHDGARADRARDIPATSSCSRAPSPRRYALIGELLATQAQVRGVAGILVDGAVRDLDELAAIGLPIWARFVRAQGATKGEVGKLDVPVVVGGAEIRPGDLVVMDCDGAMALPAERVDEVLPLALEREQREARDARALRRGRAVLRPAGAARARRRRLMEVAVLGLGEAGGRIAADLVAAGCTVRGWDPAAAARRASPTPRATARRSRAPTSCSA